MAQSAADRKRRSLALIHALKPYRDRDADVRRMYVIRNSAGMALAYIGWDDEARSLIVGRFPETKKDLPTSFLGVDRVGWMTDKQWVSQIKEILEERFSA